MSSIFGPAKCLRCGNADAFEMRDNKGFWSDLSCHICGFVEHYGWQGEEYGYRRECPIAMAHYISKDRQGPDAGSHEERFSNEEELESALARLRGQMESGEVYWESVFVTRWHVPGQFVEFMMGSPACLDWKPPMRRDV